MKELHGKRKPFCFNTTSFCSILNRGTFKRSHTLGVISLAAETLMMPFAVVADNELTDYMPQMRFTDRDVVAPGNVWVSVRRNPIKVEHRKEVGVVQIGSDASFFNEKALALRIVLEVRQDELDGDWLDKLPRAAGRE